LRSGQRGSRLKMQQPVVAAVKFLKFLVEGACPKHDPKLSLPWQQVKSDKRRR